MALLAMYRPITITIHPEPVVYIPLIRSFLRMIKTVEMDGRSRDETGMCEYE